MRIIVILLTAALIATIAVAAKSVLIPLHLVAYTNSGQTSSTTTLTSWNYNGKIMNVGKAGRVERVPVQFIHSWTYRGVEPGMYMTYFQDQIFTSSFN